MSDVARVSDMRVIPGGEAGRSRSARSDRAAHDASLREEPARHARSTRHEPTIGERIGDAISRLVGTVQAHPLVTIAIVAVIAFVIMLYGPMRDWYVSMRSGQDLQLYYQALQEQQGVLLEDLERLQTREGIEDEARKHGYVIEDETGVLVENLPTEGLTLPDQIEVDYETTWDQKILDVVFGYTPGHWQ